MTSRRSGLRILRTSLLLLVGALLAPWVAIAWLVRPALRPGWRERMGDIAVPSRGRVWVHGASLGEAQVVSSLVARLEADGVSCFATALSETGRETLANRLGASPHAIPHAYSPIDHPWSVARAFERIAPRALVLVETELWPFLILGALVRGVPVFVVSARLSDPSFPRYRALRFCVSPLLSRFAGVAARSEEDAARFIELGAKPERVRVLGDLKLDPVSRFDRVAADLVRALDGQPVVIGGSTHPGEEAALLDALTACGGRGHSAVLVLAPRHLERTRAVIEEATASGRRVVQRTRLEGASLCPGDVLVLDTTGELAALYATASAAFVGGTLAPIGGHNLLEPLFQGAPVVLGPEIENVRETARIALDCGAAMAVDDARELGDAFGALLADPKDARARGAAGREALTARAGNVERTARWLREHGGEVGA